MRLSNEEMQKRLNTSQQMSGTGRISPGFNFHSNFLEQTARTCQSLDFTLGATTDQTKSTMSNPKHTLPMASFNDAQKIINSSRDHIKIFGGSRLKSQYGEPHIINRFDHERRHLGTAQTNSRESSVRNQASHKPWRPTPPRNLPQ